MRSVLDTNPAFVLDPANFELYYAVAVSFAAVLLISLVKNYLMSVKRGQEVILNRAPVSMNFSSAVGKKWLDLIIQRNSAKDLIY